MRVYVCVYVCASGLGMCMSVGVRVYMFVCQLGLMYTPVPYNLTLSLQHIP